METGRQSALGHAGSTQHPLPLHQTGRRNDYDIVAPALGAGFKEERHIEGGNWLAAGTRQRQKPILFGYDQRVDDALETGERLCIRKDDLPELRAIDPSCRRLDTRKRRRHRRYGGADWRQQPMNRAIGIEKWNPKPPQRRRGGALAHADRSGEAENYQPGARVERIAARNPAVTCTGAPNHASNPGRT